MGQERDGDAAGSGVSISPQHSGLGVQQGHTRPLGFFPVPLLGVLPKKWGKKSAKRASDFQKGNEK